MRFMRFVITLLLFSCGAIDAAMADNKTETITVDQAKLCDACPGVWFSPSTGEIVPATTKSEKPPDGKYEIWIEPKGPTFGYVTKVDQGELGFAQVGKGQAAFEAPVLSWPLNLRSQLPDVVWEISGQDSPVFYCAAASSECLIMVTQVNLPKGFVSFAWRLHSTPEAFARRFVRSLLAEDHRITFAVADKLFALDNGEPITRQHMEAIWPRYGKAAFNRKVTCEEFLRDVDIQFMDPRKNKRLISKREVMAIYTPEESDLFCELSRMKNADGANGSPVKEAKALSFIIRKVQGTWTLLAIGG